MNTTTKKKLCWNCEGNVQRDATNCIYCGVYLQHEEYEEEDNLHLSPPYSSSGREDEESLRDAPYKPEETLSSELELGIREDSSKSILKRVVLAQISLSLSSLLAIFGVILFFFSREGVLTLRWDGEFWPYYLLLAAPLFLIGLRALKSLEMEKR